MSHDSELLRSFFESAECILKGLIIGAILFALMYGTSQALFGWPS